jgi:predicted enzyme related to lactoylglutathione lyase/uncharacterized protein YndB with AHSA1/START domain
MNRPSHFEIHAENLERAKKFYTEVFGWAFQKWENKQAGAPEYYLITTGKDDPGINGGMFKRMGQAPTDGAAVNAYVVTMDVANIDETIGKIEQSGGKVAVKKFAMPGMAWLAYYKDTEGNILGLYQADAGAQAVPDALTAKADTYIDAPVKKVWEALTDPGMVKEWLFGTEMSVTGWKTGGQIRYKGNWQGKEYEDKGEILEIEPESKLVSSYWSSMSGKPDIPESYQKVSYILIPDGSGTTLTIIQEGSDSEESKKHSEQNWSTVLANLKKLVEIKNPSK